MVAATSGAGKGVDGAALKMVQSSARVVGRRQWPARSGHHGVRGNRAGG
jgi:hypothetical protein